MATIEKRKQTANGDTYYRVRVRIQGLPEKQKTFTRLTDAKLWAQQTEAAIRRGDWLFLAGEIPVDWVGDWGRSEYYGAPSGVALAARSNPNFW